MSCVIFGAGKIARGFVGHFPIYLRTDIVNEALGAPMLSVCKKLVIVSARIARRTYAEKQSGAFSFYRGKVSEHLFG